MTARMTAHTARPVAEPGTAPLAPIAVVLALLLLVAAATQLGRLTGWADDYGGVLVYLAFVLYLSITSGLLWWGVRTIRLTITRH